MAEERKIAEHWNEIDPELRTLILERARSDRWWRHTFEKIGKFKNAGVLFMVIFSFFTWGTDLLKQFLELLGFQRGG